MSKDYFDNEGHYVIDITTDNDRKSLADEIRSLDSLKSIKMVTKKEEPKEDDTVVVSALANKKKKKEKKKKKTFLTDSFEFADDEDDTTKSNNEIDEETLLDVDQILMESKADDDYSEIMKNGKSGYKKLKKDKNDYKKEFAEELTLLYNLLDETSKFGKGLEKDLSALKGGRSRGVSKYTNDLTELILTSKQNKLNILKEISGIKKTIADLKMKEETKNKKNGDNVNSPEQLASAYFKNILNHGRSNFINAISDGSNPYTGNDDYDNISDHIERIRNSNDDDDDDDDEYSDILMKRLEGSPNPYRSDAGSKYIEYEQAGVKIYVKKCIDTGEWEFIAIDKNRQQVYDYPVPTKREAGRMKFSDDGSYASDSKGRIYNVIEYYLPSNDDDDDDD